MLLCSPTGLGEQEQWVELAGDVALETSQDLGACESFAGASLDVLACAGVAAHAYDSDGVQGRVRLPIASPVESVSASLARRRR